MLEADSFEEMKEVNVTGTQYMVDLSLAQSVEKFCYVSSISTLGNPVGNQPINERDFFNPDAQNTDYAISKYGGVKSVISRFIDFEDGPKETRAQLVNNYDWMKDFSHRRNWSGRRPFVISLSRKRTNH